MDDRIGLIFLKNCPPYNEGDGAKFSPHKAKQYLKMGFAKLAEPTPEVEKAVNEAEPPPDSHPAENRRGRRSRT